MSGPLARVRVSCVETHRHQHQGGQGALRHAHLDGRGRAATTAVEVVGGGTHKTTRLHDGVRRKVFYATRESRVWLVNGTNTGKKADTLGTGQGWQIRWEF